MSGNENNKQKMVESEAATQNMDSLTRDKVSH